MSKVAKIGQDQLKAAWGIPTDKSKGYTALRPSSRQKSLPLVPPRSRNTVRPGGTHQEETGTNFVEIDN